MKLRLTAFFFGFMSFTMISGYYGFVSGVNDLPDARYRGGHTEAMDFPLVFLPVAALMSAIIGIGFLVAIVRKEGRPAFASRLNWTSFLCIAPTVLHFIRACVLTGCHLLK